MDFDALVLLKNILTSEEVKDTDIMLLRSAIKNGNINIGLSISQSIDLIFASCINESEFMTYLGEFINCDQEYLNTPIYKLFLRDICFYPLLLDALKKNNFNEEIFASIVYYLFEKLTVLQGEDYTKLSLFIKDFITWKKSLHYSLPEDRTLFIEFVCHNVDSLSNQNYDDLCAQVNKDIVLKLLSYCYIKLSDLMAYGDGTFLKLLIVSLLDSKDYSYLLSIITRESIDAETSEKIQRIIKDYIDETNVVDRTVGIIVNKLKSFDGDLSDKKLLSM